MFHILQVLLLCSFCKSLDMKAHRDAWKVYCDLCSLSPSSSWRWHWAPLAAQQKGCHGARPGGVQGQVAASCACCGATLSTPAAQLPVKQGGLCRACRTPAPVPRGAQALSCPLQGAGLRWPHSALGTKPMELGTARKGTAEHADRSRSSQSWLLFESRVPFRSLVTHMSSSHPVPEAKGKARTRRVSTNAASGGLWKRAPVFTLQSTAVSWDPWELNAVVLPTLGLPHFSHACTNSRVSNYKKENRTVQNMKFQESVFLIHVYEKLHEYKVVLHAVLLTEQNEKKIYSFLILLFTLEHFWHRKFLLFIEQLCQIWKPITHTAI